MILILASIADGEAVSFAGELGGSASVLTCNDLVRGPIRVYDPGFDRSEITVNGRLTSVREISVVLNLLPTVMANELVAYPPAERTYQAAELRALLVFFLSQLRCPVINRATPMSFNGTIQNPAAWFAVAENVGIPAAFLSADSRGKTPLGGLTPCIEVVTIGGRLVTPTGSAADDYTVELAHRARVEYLRATYQRDGSGIRLLGADSYPDIRQPATRAALRDYLFRTAA